MPQPRCYWCNREIQPDDLTMGLVFVAPPAGVVNGSNDHQEPRPFHTVCLSTIGGTADDD